MGSTIQGVCKCGFDTGTFNAGGGFRDFITNCSAPAVCLHCNKFVVKNYMKTYSRCPTCRKKVTFYNDSRLQKQPKKTDNQYKDAFSWNVNDEKGTFRLPETRYYCPECKQMALEFIHVGCWD